LKRYSYVRRFSHISRWRKFACFSVLFEVCVVFFTKEKTRSVETHVRNSKSKEKHVSSHGTLKTALFLFYFIFFRSDAYYKCAMQNAATTLYHPVGTAQMGPVEKPWTVVNHRLKVHGLKGLRIADGSVMPLIPRGLFFGVIWQK